MRAGCPRTRAAACGQDARVPGPLHAGRMPAYPDRCMRAGCPRTRAAACGQDAHVPRPLHAGRMPAYPDRCLAGRMPAYPGRCMRARCPRTRTAACGQEARIPGQAGCLRTRAARGYAPFQRTGNILRTSMGCPGRNAPCSLVSTVAIPRILHQRSFGRSWHRLNTLL
jgi:hypothetical protein